MRRNIARDPHAYSEEMRLLFSSRIETGDFFAEESFRYQNHLGYLNAINAQRFGVNSPDSHFVGRDFMTNQPIFKKY
jgi:hypothetical protein